jgi:DNA-binding MarR family transcriptional regulator
MSQSDPMSLSHLQKLAEFRFQLRKFLSFSETVSDELGISAQQYQLLQVIAATTEHRGASISYLAERMILRHNSAVELVDRAVRAGLVRRETDDEDLRRSLVLLTSEGSRLMEILVEKHLVELETHGSQILVAMQGLTVPRKRGPGVESIGTAP